MVPSHSVGTCTLAGRRTLFSKKVMVASGMKSIKMLQFRGGRTRHVECSGRPHEELGFDLPLEVTGTRDVPHGVAGAVGKTGRGALPLFCDRRKPVAAEGGCLGLERGEP